MTQVVRVKLTNKLGKPAQLFFGVSDHKKNNTEWVFYCGQPRDFKCPVGKCADKCGPETGCQCTACKELTQLFRTGISGTLFGHQHELMWATVSAYTCALCKKAYRETSRFRCFDCNFDVCAACHNNKDWAAAGQNQKVGREPNIRRNASNQPQAKAIWLADAPAKPANAKLQGSGANSAAWLQNPGPRPGANATAAPAPAGPRPGANAAAAPAPAGRRR
eukprot:TRINITY_DN3259_c0_g1_i2.p1 TRINITY_DN3259_c0_g1~~TRINITY_DN3259_c0_g1_i2.p1  ORF type:complete len:220 (+),score=0.39 TRINITY_DN3259_c0_g1_i2:93-752(+)